MLNSEGQNPKGGSGKPKADELLRRIRSNIGETQSHEMTPEEIEQIEEKHSRENEKKISFEEFYGYDPIVREPGSNIDHRGRSASNRPTRKRFSAEKGEREKNEKNGKTEKTGEVSFDGDSLDEETEMNLMSIFGMEKTDAESQGDDLDGDYGDDDGDDDDELSDDPYADEAAFSMLSSARKSEEYTDRSQNKKLFTLYKRRYLKSLLTLAACVMLALFVSLLEFAEPLGIKLPSFFDSRFYPGVTALLELQAIVLFVAMMPKRFLQGLSSLFLGRADSNSLFSVTMIASAIYLIAISRASGGDNVAFFGSVAAVSACLCALSAHLDLGREIRSFGIIAGAKDKLTVYRMNKKEASHEIEQMARFLPEDNKFLAVTKAKKVTGFYRNFNMHASVTSGGKFMVLSGILVALVFGLFIFIEGHGISKSLSSAYTVLMTALPFSLYFVYAYPLGRLSRRAGRKGCAVIGVHTLDRFTAPATVTFGDDDVFPEGSVRIASFKNYGSTSLDKVLHHAAAVLCPTGGSLGKLLDGVAESFDITDDMEYLSVSDDGIEAAVDGDHVFMGTYHFIVRNHLKIPYDVDIDEGRDVFMFMSIGDEVVAKFRLSYTPSPDFKGIVEKLFSAGMTVAIKTFDPNIDLSLLCRTVGIDEKQPIKIIHTHDPLEVYEVRDSIDSTLVSIGGMKALTDTLHRTEKTRRVIGICSVIAGLSTLIAAIVMGITLTMTDLSQIPSYYIALYQLFWLPPTVIIAMLFS